MTIKEIQDCIDKIKDQEEITISHRWNLKEKKFKREQDMYSVWNNPEAHILEDVLRNDFIKYIAKRKDYLGKKARLILSTNDMKFGRWVE